MNDLDLAGNRLPSTIPQYLAQLRVAEAKSLLLQVPVIDLNTRSAAIVQLRIENLLRVLLA